MLLLDMQPGDCARITRCLVEPVPADTYQGVLVMRYPTGWVVLQGQNKQGRNMRGDIFVSNSGPLYEVELVKVDITVDEW